MAIQIGAHESILWTIWSSQHRNTLQCATSITFAKQNDNFMNDMQVTYATRRYLILYGFTINKILVQCGYNMQLITVQ